MSSVEKFRLFSILFGVLETVASLRQPISLTFRNGVRQNVGLVALEGGLIRFGIHVEGLAYLDETFMREAGTHAPLLSKFARREPLSPTEKLRLQSIPLAVRRALRAVTARALRRIALLSDPSQIHTEDRVIGTDQQSSSVSLLFSPVELMLAAGCSGTIRYADLAVRWYEAPPELVQERWLFEWQPDPAAGPWPIMTTRMAERRTSIIALFGQLGQQLVKKLQSTRPGGERRPLAAAILCSNDYAYYLITTQHYFTLLMYQVSHLERLLKSLELLLHAEEHPRVSSGPGGGPLRPPTPRPALATRALPPPAPAAKALPTPAEAASGESEAAVWLEAVATLPHMADEPLTPIFTNPIPAPASPAAPAPSPASVVPVAPVVPAEPVAPTVLPAVAAEPAAATTTPSVPAAPEPQAPLGPPRFPTPLLEIRELTARIDERTVLKRLSLQIGARGVYTLMGPGGSGKSSLLGILSGRNRAGSGWTLEGEVFYQGAVLGSAARPAVIEQRLAHPAVRLRDYLVGELDEGVADAYAPEQLRERLREQLGRVHLAELGEHLDEVLGHGELRLSQAQWGRLALARELMTDPPLLCVDEPTAGLPDAEAALVLTALQAERHLRAVLIVTHHQQQARDCSDYLILLAGGCVHEYQATAAFFTRPQSEAALAFVRTGGCAVPSPDAEAEQLEAATPGPLLEPPSAPPAAALAVVPAASAALSLPAVAPSSWPAPGATTPSSAPVSAPDSLVLRLRDFGLRLGGRVLLAGINLDVAARGVHLLVTAAATDKRLLLRALCGPWPSTFELLGEALYKGRPLTGSDAPVTPVLDSRLSLMSAAEYLASSLLARGSSPSSASAERAAQAMLEQAGWPELGARLEVPMCDLEPYERRVVELLGTTATSPALLILDEPLAGVGADELPRLLLLLRHQATQRALLLLVHDRGPLPLLDGPLPPRVMWFVDGRVQDSAPAAATPPPAPERPAEKGPASSSTGLTVEQAPRPSRGSGPRGFHWLRHGSLAGMPAPGLTNDLDYDLGLIRAAGVGCLVTLTSEPLPAVALREHELESLFFPIPDMEAPAFDAAAELAQQVAGLLARGLPVGFHCKAGLGRTGTMLAAQLVWEGAEAGAALVQVRHVEPGWVQSNKQEQFLFGFQDWLQQRRLWRPAVP